MGRVVFTWKQCFVDLITDTVPAFDCSSENTSLYSWYIKMPWSAQAKTNQTAGISEMVSNELFRLYDNSNIKLQLLWCKKFYTMGACYTMAPVSGEAWNESCLLLVVFFAVLCHYFGWAPGWCQGPVGANWATVSRPLGKHSSWRGTGTKPCRGEGSKSGGGFPFTIALHCFSQSAHSSHRLPKSHVVYSNMRPRCLSAKSSNTSWALVHL